MEKSAEAYFRSMADDLDPYPGNLKKHEVKQTTNDPQAPYHPTFKIPAGPHPSNPNVVKAQQREPLLSDEAGWALCPWTTGRDSWEDPLRIIRDFYEAKITSGELRVVRLMSGNGIPNMTPTDTWTDSPWLCDDCGTEWMQRQNDIEVERPSFCPGCGAKIIE